MTSFKGIPIFDSHQPETVEALKRAKSRTTGTQLAAICRPDPARRKHQAGPIREIAKAENLQLFNRHEQRRARRQIAERGGKASLKRLRDRALWDDNQEGIDMTATYGRSPAEIAEDMVLTMASPIFNISREFAARYCEQRFELDSAKPIREQAAVLLDSWEGTNANIAAAMQLWPIWCYATRAHRFNT